MSLLNITNFYIIIFIATFLFYIEKNYTSKNRVFEKISILFLIIIAGLRYNTGRDYLNYYQIYDWIKEGGDRFEIGFYYLFKILGTLDFSYQFSIFLISTFVILTVYYALIKPIPLRYRYVSLFFFLIIYENYFNVAANSLLRQSISIAIFIISVQYIIKKKFIAYFLMILLGTMFHLSALLMLPFYFLRIIKIKFFYYPIFLLGVFFIFPTILPSILKIILESIGLDKMANLNYLSVINRDFSIKEAIKNIFYIFIFIQFILVYKLGNKSFDEKETIYIKLLLIGLIFKLYIILGLDIFHRVLPYFYIFYIPVVYIFLRKNKNIKNGYIMSTFFLLFFIFHVKQILSPPEYSKYYGQFQFIAFKTKQEVSDDISIWNNENNEILKRLIQK